MAAMDNHVQELVLQPFITIVERGNTALNNAKEAGEDAMQEAAQNLIKEGERALKKLEPTCKRLHDEYSTNFVTALQENETIAEFVTSLDDLVYDFDDYVEVDGFDATKFAELQALSRKAAPKINQILIRLQLEVPQVVERLESLSLSSISRASSVTGGRSSSSPWPDTASNAPIPPIIGAGGQFGDDALVAGIGEIPIAGTSGPPYSSRNASGHHMPNSPLPIPEEREEEEQAMMPLQAQMMAKAGPELGLNMDNLIPPEPSGPIIPTSASPRGSPLPLATPSPVHTEVQQPMPPPEPPINPEDIPREPTVNPWVERPAAASSVDMATTGDDPMQQRRARVPTFDDVVSPITPQGRESAPPLMDSPFAPKPRKLTIGVDRMESARRKASSGSAETIFAAGQVPPGVGVHPSSSVHQVLWGSEQQMVPAPLALPASPSQDTKTLPSQAGASPRPLVPSLQRVSVVSSTNSSTRDSVFSSRSEEAVSPETENRTSVVSLPGLPEEQQTVAHPMTSHGVTRSPSNPLPSQTQPASSLQPPYPTQSTDSATIQPFNNAQPSGVHHQYNFPPAGVQPLNLQTTPVLQNPQPVSPPPIMASNFARTYQQGGITQPPPLALDQIYQGYGAPNQVPMTNYPYHQQKMAAHSPTSSITTVTASWQSQKSSAPVVPPLQTTDFHTGLEAVQPVDVNKPLVDLPDVGVLIPVTPDDLVPYNQRHFPVRNVDCTITINSSFHQFKGFCEGAKEVMRGQPGVRTIKKPGIGAGTITVAKCLHCMFELDMREVKADLSGSSEANYKTAGVGFRLRFASKCHLPTRHVDEQLYGCLFCIQENRTTEESDATVFFSQRALFAHLARHPRPLPAVPNLTVIEGPEIPPAFANNYDLHFPSPPVPSLMAGIAEEVARMPVAVAIESVRAINNTLRFPPGTNHANSNNKQGQPLQFAAGAKIVGVEFPMQWGGEWAIGWTDNVRGAFRVESVRLEPPPKADIRPGQSNMQALTRWKRQPKEKEPGDWLKFDKNETITGITYPYVEHWCWAGINSKGKWGIFPQVFLEPNTLRETPTLPDTASIRSGGSGGNSSSSASSKILSSLSLKRHPKLSNMVEFRRNPIH